MRVLIAGAGTVGQAIARELGTHHEVTLVDHDLAAIQPEEIPAAYWLHADACELSVLQQIDLTQVDVVVAATGDDKANLVLSFLAKTEFGVPKTVARVNHVRNEWLFDAQWGVDVAVSTARIMTTVVEEALTVGSLVKVFELAQSSAGLYEYKVPADFRLLGQRLGDFSWPLDTVLVSIVRQQLLFAPQPHDTLEKGDSLLFMLGLEADREQLQELLSPAPTTK